MCSRNRTRSQSGYRRKMTRNKVKKSTPDNLEPNTKEPGCCPPKPSLSQRLLVNAAQSKDLVKLFKIFANDTRLRLLHALVRGTELCVSDLADAIGMKPQTVSNQLQKLVDRRVLGARRDGKNILYRVDDPCVARGWKWSDTFSARATPFQWRGRLPPALSHD
jgi:DNA-binding transcriptional ArsR family regulator